MQFHFSLYSSVLLIFFSQGIVFTFLLLKKAFLKRDKPAAWLGVYVFLSSLYLLPWMLGFAGWYSLQPYRDIMFYAAFQQLFLIGPVMYFYTQSLLNPSFRLRKKNLLHLLPALAYTLYRLVIFTADKIILHKYYFYGDQRDKGLDTWYQVAGFASMLLYFLLSLKYYILYRKLILQTTSFADSLLFGWIKKYLLAIFTMQLLWLTFFLFFPG